MGYARPGSSEPLPISPQLHTQQQHPGHSLTPALGMNTPNTSQDYKPGLFFGKPSLLAHHGQGYEPVACPSQYLSHG